MTTTQVGLAVGAVLGVVAVAFGLGEMLVVAAFLAVGGLVGRVASGRTDVHALWDALRGRRSSS